MVDSRKDFINRDKVWMKYYSEEAKNAKLPDCTAYDYVKRLNKDRYDAPALHYYGNDITFGELVEKIKNVFSPKKPENESSPEENDDHKDEENVD